jgi:hypothetical protein
MSVTDGEILVDLAELDAKKTEAAAKKAATGKDVAAVVDPAAVAAPKKDAPTTVSPEEGLAKVQKQLDDEKIARLKAENERDAAQHRARTAEQGEVAARTDVQTTQLDLVKTAITQLSTNADSLVAKYAEAAAAGDWTTAAKIQSDMSLNSARLVTLEDGKKRLEAAPKPVARPSSDPVEEYVSRIGAEYPRSRAWLRAHPDFVRDRAKNDQMVAAHNLAVARGYALDTDDYFKDVEETLRIRKADPDPKDPALNGGGEDPLTDAATPTGNRTAAPAGAPPSRSGNGAGGNRPGVVRLTADEREIARLNGMTDEEYAREKVALKAEGRLN